MHSDTSLPNIASLTDEELWSHLCEGHDAALAHLFDRHFERLFSYGLKFGHHADNVKDAIQDVFVRLWERHSTLGVAQSVRSYLIVCLRRRLLENHNKQKLISYLPVNGTEPYFDPVFTHEDMIIEDEFRSEQRRELLNALNTLTPRQKEILYLKYYSGMSYEEICYITGLAHQTSRNYLHEALEKLRKVLGRKELTFLFLFETLRVVFSRM